MRSWLFVVAPAVSCVGCDSLEELGPLLAGGQKGAFAIPDDGKLTDAQLQMYIAVKEREFELIEDALARGKL